MRDDFSKAVKDLLAKRVGYLCSNPNCRQPTIGPQPASRGAMNVGVAAHISAAAPRGPRYDPLITRDQRTDPDNGIWLCQKCGKLVDSDRSHYTVQVLHEWKAEAEAEALRKLEGLSGASRGVEGEAFDELKLLVGRVEIIEQQVQEQVERNVGVQPNLRMEGSTRPDDIPLRPVFFASRATLVDRIAREFNERVWVSLTASSGMGKTQVARSIWEHWENGPKLWISLRGENELLPSHIDAQLLRWHRELAGDDTLSRQYDTGQLGVHELIQSVGSLARSGALVTIDNIPDCLGDALLVDRLAYLGSCLRDAKGRALSTSQYGLPGKLLDVLGMDAAEIPVPPMDTHDVRELLQNAGAPAALSGDNIGGLLLGLTKGHPTLLAAAILWLRGHGWILDNSRLETLLAGGPMKRPREETRALVRKVVDDEETRELLDRLSIIGSTFGLNMVRAVAKAEPPVARATERFHDLVGPWIQDAAASRFDVSPLLQWAGKEYLDSELQKRVHASIAREYLQEGSLAADDALQACSHLFGAADWIVLAHVLIGLLLSIKTANQARRVWWAQFFFRPGEPWPDCVATKERIILRGLQTRTLLLSGEACESLEADLERLISESGLQDADAVAIARFHTGVMLDTLPPGVTARRGIQAARASRLAGPHPEGPMASPELMFWAAIPKLRSLDQIEELAAIAKGMTDEERGVVFNEEFGPQMSVFLADFCYAFEADKTSSDRDWNAVLRVLGRLEEIGRLPGAEPLFVASLRARAVVLADYLGCTDDALELLSGAADGKSAEAEFVLSYTKACILLAKSRVAESYAAFREVAGLGGNDRYPFMYYDALKRGTQAAGRVDEWEQAKCWCIRAIAAGRGQGWVDVYERLELLGELAWIHWCAGRREKAAAAIWGVVRKLVWQIQLDNPRYRQTYQKLGHVLGWLASYASTGRPMAQTLDGDTYSPTPGVLLSPSPPASG